MYRAKMMTSAQINTEGAEIAYIDGLNAMKRFSKRVSMCCFKTLLRNILAIA